METLQIIQDSATYRQSSLYTMNSKEEAVIRNYGGKVLCRRSGTEDSEYSCMNLNLDDGILSQLEEATKTVNSNRSEGITSGTSTPSPASSGESLLRVFFPDGCNPTTSEYCMFEGKVILSQEPVVIDVTDEFQKQQTQRRNSKSFGKKSRN